MSNKKWIIIIIILALAGLVGLAIWNKNIKNNSEASDATRFHQSYPSVSEKNRFVFATNQEILDIFEDGTGLVFLGFPACPWCQKLAPIANQAAEQAGLDKIYYLNIQEARKNNDDLYQKLVAYLKNDLQKDEQGNPRIFVPDLTAISDGQIVGRFKQTPADGSPTPDEYWTTEHKTAAVKQIEEMIKNMNQTEFSRISEQVENNEATLIDVRTPEEFSAGHFPNAINLNVEEIANGKMPDKPKDSKIYLYCRSGNRSAQATTLLERDGFTNITDLGGLADIEAIGGKLSNR